MGNIPIKKILWRTGLVIILIASLVFYILFYWSYSTGSRFGKLVKLSQKGIMFKEWEGSVVMGLGDSSLSWSFSIHDDHMGEELLRQMGEVIQIDYKEHMYRWIYNTPYEVTHWRVKDINEAKICPFLYLLRSDSPTLDRVTKLIVLERPDLEKDVFDCKEKIAGSTSSDSPNSLSPAPAPSGTTHQ